MALTPRADVNRKPKSRVPMVPIKGTGVLPQASNKTREHTIDKDHPGNTSSKDKKWYLWSHKCSIHNKNDCSSHTYVSRKTYYFESTSRC